MTYNEWMDKQIRNSTGWPQHEGLSCHNTLHKFISWELTWDLMEKIYFWCKPQVATLITTVFFCLFVFNFVLTLFSAQRLLPTHYFYFITQIRSRSISMILFMLGQNLNIKAFKDTAVLSCHIVRMEILGSLFLSLHAGICLAYCKPLRHRLKSPSGLKLWLDVALSQGFRLLEYSVAVELT